jgi:hypothetical protein
MAVSVGANRRDAKNHPGAIVAVAVTFAAPLNAQMPQPNTSDLQPPCGTLTMVYRAAVQPPRVVHTRFRLTF